MTKYLATLERLAPRFGSEHVPVCHLRLLAQAEAEACYIHDHRQSPANPCNPATPEPPTHEVLVTGTGGIQWRSIPEKVRARAPSLHAGALQVGGHCLLHARRLFLNWQDPSGGSDGGEGHPRARASLSGKEGRAPKDAPSEQPTWTHFCDFQDITHLVLGERHVSIHLQDNQCLVGPWRGRAGRLQGRCVLGPGLTAVPGPCRPGAAPALPGRGPVLRGAGGRLFPAHHRLQPLPVP